MSHKKNCGCSQVNPCSPSICTSYEDPVCKKFTLDSSNTEHPMGYTDVSDVTIDVKKISAYKEHLEFVNSPAGLSSIIGHTVLKLSAKFVDSIANIFKGRNLGTGAKVYKGSYEVGLETLQYFRTISSSDSITITEGDNDITPTVNETWLAEQFPTIPSVDYPVIESEDIGTGTSLRKDVTAKKIGIRTLTSDDFIIAEQLDGSVKISSPGGGSTSSDWFLDATFSRPSNWGTAQNPKEEIVYSTSMVEINPLTYTNGQTVKVAKGTLNDPFKSYEEYLLKRIYGSGGTGTGTPSKSNPNQVGVTLQILSNISTASHIEVLNTTLYLRNNSTLNYTGTRDYAIDYATIFDALAPGASLLPFSTPHVIKGEGTITRSNGFGLVRNKSDETKTANGNLSILSIIGEGRNGLLFLEGENSGLYTNLTNESGGILMNGNGIVRGSTQAPVHPLISIVGNNFQYWNTGVDGSRIFIFVKTQVGIECKDNGRITSSAERFMFQVSNENIGYETRLTSTAIGDDLLLVNHFYDAPDGQGKIYYKAYDGFSVFKTTNTGVFRIENLITVPNGFVHAGANSIISLSGNSEFRVEVNYTDVGGGSAVNLVKYSGPSNGVTIKNGNITPYYYRLVKGDATNQLSFNFISSRVSSNIIAQDVPSFEVYTGGTLSSIKDRPIMTITDIYADVAAASAAGLIKGTLFKTSAGDVQQVNI